MDWPRGSFSPRLAEVKVEMCTDSLDSDSYSRIYTFNLTRQPSVPELVHRNSN
jgi:hypothetical protein